MAADGGGERPGGVPMEDAGCAATEPFALQVTDDSMEPEFARGCVITIDPSAIPEPGDFVLAQLDDGFIFRQLAAGGGGYRLVALRPGVDAIALGPDLSRVRGVVTQRAGRRRRDHKRYDVGGSRRG